MIFHFKNLNENKENYFEMEETNECNLLSQKLVKFKLNPMNVYVVLYPFEIFSLLLQNYIAIL